VIWRTGSTRRREIRLLLSAKGRIPPSFFNFCPKSDPRYLPESGHLFRLLLSVGFSLAAFFGGCRKAERPLHASEIHAITREFLAAAASAGVSASDLHSYLEASDESPHSSDRADITIRPNANDPSGATARVLQSLGGVATRHGLTQEAPAENPGEIIFRYSRRGFPTHTIHIEFAPAVTQKAPAPDHARLAIILDDLGNDRSAAEAIFALPYPMTISVLPNHVHSVEIAEEAHRRGYQVMLHLPMESVGQGKPESQELRPGMSGRDVNALVDGFLRAVPNVAGVNNHQGSQSTADVKLMDELMPVLREHRLFYIDSRTTAATVAYDAAQRAGVQSGFRNVPFLDDVAEVAAVSKQLRLALREAREKGGGIAIGHPHPATLKALAEVLPEAKSQGVQLVFASELVH
jgi:polysaccharide deacetylase 2 family uncharacterized protein YibQ